MSKIKYLLVILTFAYIFTGGHAFASGGSSRGDLVQFAPVVSQDVQRAENVVKVAGPYGYHHGYHRGWRRHHVLNRHGRHMRNCYIRRERVMTPMGYQVRRIRVCRR